MPFNTALLNRRFRSGGIVSTFAIALASSSYTFASGAQPYTATGITISDSADNGYPNDIIFAFDLVDNYFYWDGAVRSLGDATDNLNGTYQVTLSTSINFGSVSGFVEGVGAASSTQFRNIFSASNPSNHRFEVENSSGTIAQVRLYSSAMGANSNSTFVGNQANNYNSTTFRAAWSSTIGSPVLLCQGSASSASNPNGASISLNRIAIGYRRFASDQPYDGTFRRVYVFANPKTQDELKSIIDTERSNIGDFWIGDSFLNNGQIRLDFHKTATLRDQYFHSAQWSAGGTTLTQQASDFAANRSRFYNSTLVIVDGGLDTNGATSITALESMISKLGHDRWVYMQSNPIDATGVGNRPAWDTASAAIAAFCGADHYVETLELMQANGDGGADDNTDIANDIWPRSLRADATHPNAAGNAILAQAIYDHFIEQGWFSYTVTLTLTGGGTLSVNGTTDADVTGDDTATLRVSGNVADVNTELGTLAIAGLSAGSHSLTVSLYDPVTGKTTAKTVGVVVT